MAKYKGLSFAEKKKVVSKALVSEILGTIFYCVAAILLAVVLVLAFGMKVSVVGSSMEPTLVDGQELLIDRFVFKLLSPDRYDIVCFYPRGNEHSHLYVERVIGLPGETVVIKDGYVYIDGVRLIEPVEYDIIEEAGLAEVEIKLGTDEFFVLGDNRNNSEDSRLGNVGAVNKSTMVGKVWFKLSKDESSFGFAN